MSTIIDMGKKKSRKNRQGLKHKNDLSRLVSDDDFIHAFLMDGEADSEENPRQTKTQVTSCRRLNKHGLPFLDDDAPWMNDNGDTRHTSSDDHDDIAASGPEASEHPDEFATLLEASLRQSRVPRSNPGPVPLKRRLKRYPPPEAELDLHGFTAIGAQVKARFFITRAHAQGFFTLRIIVGKGLHSESGPVLPHVMEALLKEMQKENIVLSYQWEGGNQTKSGAVCVYLKRFD